MISTGKYLYKYLKNCYADSYSYHTPLVRNPPLIYSHKEIITRGKEKAAKIPSVVLVLLNSLAVGWGWEGGGKGPVMLPRGTFVTRRGGVR